MTSFIFFLGFVLIGLVIFVNSNPANLARLIKRAGPILLLLTGAGLIFLKQTGLGSLLLFAGITLWRRMRGVQQLGSKTASGPKRSHVRSAALEMELDHITGSLNGIVLAGLHEGKELDQMDRDALFELRHEVLADGESLSLLDAYFDRRFPGWREDTEFDGGAGQGSPTSSGPMSEEEAYEVLGISPDAGVAEIRKAHRRLMKTAHPDSGGSTFLAAKINEAKDVLLRSHS